jgi:hypothetical protein
MHHLVLLPEAKDGIKKKTLLGHVSIVKKTIICMLFITSALTAVLLIAHQTATVRTETAFFLMQGKYCVSCCTMVEGKKEDERFLKI